MSKESYGTDFRDSERTRFKRSRDTEGLRGVIRERRSDSKRTPKKKLKTLGVRQ